jgi:hypothetical protein
MKTDTDETKPEFTSSPSNQPVNHLHPVTTEFLFLSAWEEEKSSTTSCTKHKVAEILFTSSRITRHPSIIEHIFSVTTRSLPID